MPRSILAVASILAAVGMTGCLQVKKGSYEAWEGTKTTWNKAFGKKPAPEAPLTGAEAIDRDAYAKLGYALDWSSFAAFQTKPKGSLVSAQIVGDLFIVVDDYTYTTALSTRSGVVKWGAVVADEASRFNSITRVGNHVMFSDAAQAFILNAESGQPEAKQKFDRLATTAPIMLGDLLVMGGNDVVFAHMMRTGHDAWAYRTDAPVRVNPVYTGGSDVVAVSRDGTVMIFDVGTGTTRGVAHMAADAGTEPVVGGGAVYVASEDQSLYAFDAGNGKQRWRVRTETPLRRPIAYFNGAVYCPVPGVGTVAFNAANGNTLWTSTSITGDVIGARNGKLIAWEPASSKASTIDPKTGTVIDSVTLPNVGILRTSKFVDGDWYVTSRRGEVSKFIPR